MAVVSRRVRVTGRVQGVGYRAACRRAAAAHAVTGWARNLPDGSVEAVFEGEPRGVAAMVDWAGSGPPHALVAAVEVADEPPRGLTGFSVG